MNDVWVLAEQLEGKLNEVTFELLGKARDLALGGQTVAVLPAFKIRDQSWLNRLAGRPRRYFLIRSQKPYRNTPIATAARK